MRTVGLIVIALALPLVSSAQTVVFDDVLFGHTDTTDTYESATPQAPTSSSTAFEYFQQGGSPNGGFLPGDFQLDGRTTSSSSSELQALFTTTPVTLATVGDYINFTITYVNTLNTFPSNSASTLNIGLYNSGGSAPAQGTRLDASGEGTGGAVGWLGYVGRIVSTNTAVSSIYTRPAQGAGVTNPNQSQDVLFNGASSTSSYSNPMGSTLGTSSPYINGLTGLQTYTLQLQISLSAPGTLTINNAIYSGSGDDPANLLYSQIASTDTSLTTSFDALAFGWRYNSTSGPSRVDVDEIKVTDLVQSVPEPSVMALSGIAFAGLVARLRRK